MPASDSGVPYVFVSYASADRARVFGIAAVLEAQGVRVWLDRRSITGGRRWTTEIVHGVEDCAVLLVMSSPASAASRNVQQEVQLAWESGRPMLPVIVEEVQLPAELRYALAGQQWVEVLGRPEAEWLPELLAALRAAGVALDVTSEPAQPPAEAAGSPALQQESVDKKRIHNLPAPRTSFIGRAAELAEIELALADHRLVTLTGPGGVGKSRLALELAWRLLPNYPDGVWIVPLEATANPALVPDLVAAAAGLREIPGRPLNQQLTDRLGASKALVILDNCEHLLDPCAELAGALTTGGRELRILATSRELLGMAGEQVIPVPPLQVPAPLLTFPAPELCDSESVQLFADRARAVFPAFELAKDNAVTVAEVCRTLDGIPLAIELAAARVRTLAPHELLSRLGDVFGLLRGTDRTVLARQRTLQGAVDWSYDSLEEKERVLWRRLSVFPESFSLSAAEAVCGVEPLAGYEVLDLLAGLVDKSLVMMTRGADQTRYHLLKTLRQYAQEKLRGAGEQTDLSDRHADWCGEVIRTADAGMSKAGIPSGRGTEHRKLLKAEYPSIRAALEYLIAADRAGEALEMAGVTAMNYLWNDEYPADGRRLLELVLAHAPADRTIRRSIALRALGYSYVEALETDKAEAPLREALDLAREAGDHGGVARALNSLGISSWHSGDYGQAEARFQETEDYCRAHDVLYAAHRSNLADVLREQAQTARARTMYEGFRSRGPGDGFACLGLGWIAFMEGDPQEATRFAALATAEAKNAGIHRNLSAALTLRGASLASAGDVSEALAALEQALRMARDSGEMAYAWESLIWLGYAAWKQGQEQLAVTLLASAEKKRPFAPWFVAIAQELLQHAETQLGPTQYTSSQTAGAAMSIDQTASYALEWLEKSRTK